MLKQAHFFVQNQDLYAKKGGLIVGCQHDLAKVREIAFSCKLILFSYDFCAKTVSSFVRVSNSVIDDFDNICHV